MKNIQEIPLDWFSDDTKSLEAIKNNPILNWQLNLDTINNKFSEIYKEISGNTFAKHSKLTWWLSSLPIVGSVFNIANWIAIEKVYSYESKLNWIFKSYWETYDNLLISIGLYELGIEEMSDRIWQLKSHLSDIRHLAKEPNELLYKANIDTLIKGLTGTLTRMTIDLDTANEIRVIMKTNWPVFKNLLTSIIQEKAANIWLVNAKNAIDKMSLFIIERSNEATLDTIKLSKEVNSSKYWLEMIKTFDDNINKLKVAFEDIAKIKSEAIHEYELYEKTNADNGSNLITHKQ